MGAHDFLVKTTQFSPNNIIENYQIASPNATSKRNDL
jgi:hypothetical protein